MFNNKIELHTDMCCCGPCFSALNLGCQCFKLLSSCCLRPCCSAAAILCGFGLVGMLLAGILFAFMFGLIPIPHQVTQNICNSTRESFYFRENFTIYKMEEKNTSQHRVNLTTTRLNKTLVFNHTRPKNTSKPAEFGGDDVMNHLIDIKMKKILKSQSSLKNKMSKVIALQYDILLLPNTNTAAENEKSALFADLTVSNLASATKSLGMEMKINLDVKLHCNISTDLVYFSTREFSNIELRFFAIFFY